MKTIHNFFRNFLRYQWQYNIVINEHLQNVTIHIQQMMKKYTTNSVLSDLETNFIAKFKT